jgi:hypothetical protein
VAQTLAHPVLLDISVLRPRQLELPVPLAHIRLGNKHPAQFVLLEKYVPLQPLLRSIHVRRASIQSVDPMSVHHVLLVTSVLSQMALAMYHVSQVRIP